MIVKYAIVTFRDRDRQEGIDDLRSDPEALAEGWKKLDPEGRNKIRDTKIYDKIHDLLPATSAKGRVGGTALGVGLGLGAAKMKRKEEFREDDDYSLGDAATAVAPTVAGGALGHYLDHHTEIT